MKSHFKLSHFPLKSLVVSFFMLFIFTKGFPQPPGGWAEYNVIFGDNYHSDPHSIFFNQLSNSIWLFASKELNMVDRSINLYTIDESGVVSPGTIISNGAFTNIKVSFQNPWYKLITADTNTSNNVGVEHFIHQSDPAIQWRKEYVSPDFIQPELLAISDDGIHNYFIGNIFGSSVVNVFVTPGGPNSQNRLAEYTLTGITASDYYDVEILSNGDLLLLIGEKNTLHPSFKLLRLNNQMELLSQIEIPWYRPDNQMFIIPFEDESTFLIYSEKEVQGHHGIGVNEALGIDWYLDFDEHINFIEKESFVQGPANTLYFLRSAKTEPGSPPKTVFHRLLDNGIMLVEKEIDSEYSNEYPWRLIRDWKGNFVGASATDFGQIPSFVKDPVLLRWDENGNLTESWNLQGIGDFVLKDFISSSAGDYYLLGSHSIPGERLKNQVIRVTEENLLNEKPIILQVFKDVNGNCQFDSLDKPFPQSLLRLEDPNEKYRLSNKDGIVFYQPETDNIEVELLPPNSSWKACHQQPLQINITPAESQFIPLLLSPEENCPVLDISVVADSIVGCEYSVYEVLVQNRGTIIAEDVSVSFEHDARLSLHYAPNINFQDGTLVKMDINDLEPGESRSYKLIFNTDCDLNPSEVVCINFRALAGNDCTGGIQRQYSFKNKCQNGLIPGSPLKLGFENGVVTNRFVRKDSFVDYTLFFKNEGFTNLYNLVIEDELEKELDISTLRLGTSNFWNIDVEIIEERTLQFSFPWLYLMPGENLFINYSIKPEASLQNGDTFSNQATFKTYNQSERTNNLTLQIGERTNTISTDFSNAIRFYPNPAREVFYLETDIPIHNLALEIVHISGKSFYKGPFKKKMDVEALGLPTGSYFITCAKAGKPIWTEQLIIF